MLAESFRQARNATAIFLRGWGLGNYGTKNIFGSSCLRYYAHRNTITMKMVFVHFWGISNLGMGNCAPQGHHRGITIAVTKIMPFSCIYILFFITTDGHNDLTEILQFSVQPRPVHKVCTLLDPDSEMYTVTLRRWQ